MIKIIVLCGFFLIVGVLVLLLEKQDKSEKNAVTELPELVYIPSITELVDSSKFIRFTAVSSKKATERYGELQGFLYPDKILFLADVWVDKTHRRKGIGSKLLMELISFAKANDVKEIYGNLSVVDDVNITRDFYEKFGFEIKMLGEVGSDNTYATIHKYF